MFLYSQIVSPRWKDKLSPLRFRYKLLRQLLGLEPRCEEYWMWKLSTPQAVEVRRDKARRLFAEKQVVNVAFQVITMAKWKTDSLFETMLAHPRFAPVVWFVPYSRYTEEEVQKEYESCRRYFEAKGWPVVRYRNIADFPEAQRPDITFIHEPYEWNREYNQGLKDALFCYVPYGYMAIANGRTLNMPLNNVALYNFMDNASSKAVASRFMQTRGLNVAVTGQPMGDTFLFPSSPLPHVWKDCGERKKIIWAPHWTLSSECKTGFIAGTFLETAEEMLALARQYADCIQFAFKPHPLLYGALCKHSAWGKEKTDAYYRLWQEMPNTQLEEGEYQALFMQSDAMIHDSSSFIIEYMLADKPCMYLTDGRIFDGFSEMCQAALKCYIKGVSQEEIENFLQAVLNGQDEKGAQRTAYRKEYLLPPHGVSAAQNVIDCLMESGGYARPHEEQN